MQLPEQSTQRSTYEAIFAHPTPLDLQWSDVRAMLTELSEVTEENNGNLKFNRNGQSVVVHAPHHDQLSDIDDVLRVRHFLERSKTSIAQADLTGLHLMVVIDHREARIFRTDLEKSVPQRVEAYGTDGVNRYLHNVLDYGDGQRKVQLKPFFTAVAKALTGAEQILLFGSSTGTSSAMTHLLAELKKNHPQIASRVVGTLTVDAQHMTEPQLLAEARSFYAKPHAARAADHKST